MRTERPFRPVSTGRILGLVLVLALLLPTLAGAQRVELTPFAGARFGGEFDDDDFFGDVVEVDDGTSYGLIFDVGLTRNLFFELTAGRQETELIQEDGGILEPDIEILDIDLDYYHAGILYQWSPGQVRPFVSGSLGVTRFQPDAPGTSDESRFSVSFGGGIKVMFGDNVGLRFEARGFATWLDDDDDSFCDDCFDEDDYLTQGEVRGGLVLAF